MRGSPARHSGFTLIEVLVGTAILGIMMALMTSALFALTKSARSGESRLDETDAVRLTRTFLRRHIEQAVPLTERHADGEERLRFDGDADSLLFVGHLPAHRGGGGLHYIRLYMHRDGEGTSLAMDYLPAWPKRAPADVSHGVGTATKVLFEHVSRMRFSYSEARTDSDARRWTSQWTASDRLPELVRLEVEQVGGDRWPDVVIPVRTRTPRGQPHLFILADEDLQP